MGNKKKGGNKLNMIIAKTHRLSSRMVGMQLTSGNLVGIVLSMFQMSLGFIFLTGGMTKGLWYMVGMIGLVGCAIAILIERLSIGGLATVRESSEAKKRVEDAFYALAEHAEPSAWAIENKERQVKMYKRNIVTGWSFGGGGMFLSTGIGDIFWHTIFAPLGWLAIPYSLACACVIGLTFVHSELFKTLLDRVLKSILRDMELMQAAVAVEKNNMQLDMAASAMDTVRNDDEVRVPIEQKMAKVVIRSLSNFADMPADNGVEVEGSLVSVPQITSPSPRGQYGQYKDELKRVMASNPGISVGELAKHFSKSKSTIADWQNKLRAGL